MFTLQRNAAFQEPARRFDVLSLVHARQRERVVGSKLILPTPLVAVRSKKTDNGGGRDKAKTPSLGFLHFFQLVNIVSGLKKVESSLILFFSLIEHSVFNIYVVGFAGLRFDTMGVSPLEFHFAHTATFCFCADDLNDRLSFFEAFSISIPIIFPSRL